MEGKGVEVRGSNKDVCLDNVNAGDGENKVDLGDVYNGGGDSYDDVGVDDVGWVNTNGDDDADLVMVIANLTVVMIETVVMVMTKMMVMLMMTLTLRAKLIAVKIQLLMTLIVNLMVAVILMMMVRMVIILLVKVLMVLKDIKMMVMLKVV